MNWVAAGLVALVMSAAYLLDGPSEHDARVDTAEEKIQKLCGENAGWKMLDDKSIQCFTHRGHKTKKVTL
tara:strand:- start:494 stop:703 length:210 start_codon:yes stop_codon:yes gene_type:complete